ncbi:MAG: DEAD/DEAH box helicase [Gammaproteobacteria bacterium]|nr:DEAD/DEAH box helicase [Gammaproteobacteria bacterium]MYH86026.1 DEAD/DEAH box helicase [Gammaproteobacteria bacterium]MYK04115.1 DEAD/DEAH box helicase [Gammaproteobacteria bacterium]
MELQLEELAYQREAIDAVVSLFQGQPCNTFDMACHEGVRSNVLTISAEQISENVLAAIEGSGIDPETASLDEALEYCIEMETGTGKTLVYLKTVYELYRQYAFTKFIVLVPSVAIKEGVLSTFDAFKRQLGDLYGFTPACFEYDSKRLNRVTAFVEEQHPQIMVMTLQSFNTEDRILNQAQREDLFFNMPFIEAIARTRPIIIMDEPQEGMDTENAVTRINALKPLCRLRYSATHKVMRNLIYRLTPFDSYRQGLVKKIEVLTVAEQNQEATLRVELVEVKTYQDGKPPRAKLRLWYAKRDGSFASRESPFLKVGDDLEEKTRNVGYRGYVIRRISKPLRERTYRCEFENGAIVTEKEKAADLEGIFGEQLYWLIDSHFTKRDRLAPQGIKCLSLIFIDRVDNYVQPDGIIRRIFAEKYRQVCKEKLNLVPTEDEIAAVQGYYFAQTGKGEYTDNELSMRKNMKLFDLILKQKEELLRIGNPVEFIFTHTALGVGWDNPNVFNIATLNQSYSEIKKRQEIGRGLRISVNQEGQRVYDAEDCPEGEETNLLTIVPNETYEMFVGQYQSEIKDVYGDTSSGAKTRQKEKGRHPRKRRVTRNDAIFESDSFREFWQRLSLRTDYTVVIDEDAVVTRAVEALNALKIEQYSAEVALNRIEQLEADGVETKHLGSEYRRLRATFGSIDLVEEISEETSLAYPTVIEILRNVTNRAAIVANPARFIHEASSRIRKIELDELLRGLTYEPNGKEFDISQIEPSTITFADTIETPNRGLYDRVVYDSRFERDFAGFADNDDEVVCFLKLPTFYKIPTPIGTYNPDFGVVLRRKHLQGGEEAEFYFVVETKGTNELDDKKALRESEVYKIKCAMKHFDALGVDARVNYNAPVKDYPVFKDRAKGVMHA